MDKEAVLSVRTFLDSDLNAVEDHRVLDDVHLNAIALFGAVYFAEVLLYLLLHVGDAFVDILAAPHLVVAHVREKGGGVKCVALRLFEVAAAFGADIAAA